MKHSPGPWVNREGTILADTREQSCCGQPCVGAEYMGQQEMVCCGNPDMDGDAEDQIAIVKYEHDIPLILAAPDLLEALTKCVQVHDDILPVIAAYMKSLGVEREWEKLCAVSDLARAAIAKATGVGP